MTPDAAYDPPDFDPRDVEFIVKSLRMLPAWDDRKWWNEFTKISGLSRRYLGEKLSMLVGDWTDPSGAWYRAPYLLMFFDNPDLYEHLDAVSAWWDSARIRGRVGQRWSQQICAAAWRALIADEHHSPYTHNFEIPEGWWEEADDHDEGTTE